MLTAEELEARQAELRAERQAEYEREQCQQEGKAAKEQAARLQSQGGRIEIPALPERPSELAELITRRAAIREEWQGIEAEQRRAQDRAWLATQGSETASPERVAMDAAIDRLVTGAAEPAAPDVVPEQPEAKRSRSDFLQRADRKLSEKIHKLNERHNRSVARALRPLHRRAVQRIHAALLELEQANSEEQAVRGAIPGATIQACDFPNVGTRGPGGGPIQYWVDFARRLGLLDEGEPEAGWPTAAL